MLKKSSLSSLITVFLIATFAWADKAPQQQVYATFTSLYTAAKAKLLPKSKGGLVGQTILSVGDFKDYLQRYCAYMHDAQGDLKNKQLWLDGKVPSNIFKTTKGTMCEYGCDAYEPFVEKRLLPAGARVAVHGDLHGGFFELLEFLQHHIACGDIDDTFKIISPNFYLLFLGDYTDRGIFGAEVIYMLLRIKLANPDRVFLVRGNHEETRCTQKYGFLDECVAKFGEDDGFDLYHAIHYTYESFPVALYLGSGNGGKNYYFQTCHGGMEIGFDPKPLLADKRSHVKLLLNKLDRVDEMKKLSPALQAKLDSSLFKNVTLSNCGERMYYNIGFMWNDFMVDPQGVHCKGEVRGQQFGKAITEEILKNNSDATNNYEVVGVLRAHQHGDPEMMKDIKDGKGISRLWKSATDKVGGLWRGIVCTFTVAPDAGYGKRFGMNFDAFGLLRLGDTFEKCSLDVFQIFENKLYAKK